MTQKRPIKPSEMPPLKRFGFYVGAALAVIAIVFLAYQGGHFIGGIIGRAL